MGVMSVMRMRTTRCIVSAVALWTVGCASSPSSPFSSGRSEPIDAEARRLMRRESVQGLALAVIDGGQVVHVAAYGQRNVERDLPLTTDTVMYGASLTKTAFAYMVLQLVDEGRLDLDASVADLLPRPLPEYEDYTDLAGDERWRALTPRILLTHTSGFANFRWLEDDQTPALPLTAGHAATATRARASTSCSSSSRGARARRRQGDADARLRPLRHDPHQHDVARRTSRRTSPTATARTARWSRTTSAARERRGLDGHHHRRPGAAVGRHRARRRAQRRIARRTGAAAAADRLGAPVPDPADRTTRATPRSVSRPAWAW